MKKEERTLNPLPPLTIRELRPGMCYWPLGRNTLGQHTFCGKKAPGKMWCTEHMKIGTVPDRRKQKEAA